MLPVNFNHLYYFWAVAKEGSISAASKRLLLTQSTLSLQVKQLERSLQRTLLHRGRHGVSLTPEGKLAFEHCERMFASADGFQAMVRAGKPLPPPPLRLGVAGAVSHEIILRVLAFVQRAAPEQPVRVASGGVEEARGRLLRRLTDLVVSDIDFSSG